MRNARPVCPNPECVNHKRPARGFYVKNGYRKTKASRTPTPRYRCRDCGRNFSASNNRGTTQQHRPDLSRRIFEYAVSGMTMKRMEVLLGCDTRTIERKIALMAKRAQEAHAAFLSDPKNQTNLVMMDELETFVHARYKQLSVPVVIDGMTGKILSFGVARTPSKMILGGAGVKPLPAGGARWYYDDRPQVVPRVLADVAPLLKERSQIVTDGGVSYPKWIKQELPGVKHSIRLSPKETGLGRAKKRATGEAREHDPLFQINVLFAKMRNNIARLGRKTWTTTKSIQALENHLWLYVAWENGYSLGTSIATRKG